jgi:hypothetical protein
MKELLPRLKRLLRCHLGGDVDHLGNDARFRRIETVDLRRFEPNPRSVVCLMPQPGAHDHRRVGSQMQPVFDRERLVVGMDELHGPAANHLVGRPAKNG